MKNLIIGFIVFIIVICFIYRDNFMEGFNKGYSEARTASELNEQN